MHPYRPFAASMRRASPPFFLVFLRRFGAGSPLSSRPSPPPPVVATHICICYVMLCTLPRNGLPLIFRDRRCRWSRSVVVPATAVRVRGLGAGGCGVVVGHLAAASARRGRREHLLLAVQLWRNSAALHMHQCCLAAGIGACSHDEPADRAARDAARLAGRVQSQAHPTPMVAIVDSQHLACCCRSRDIGGIWKRPTCSARGERPSRDLEFQVRHVCGSFEPTEPEPPADELYCCCCAAGRVARAGCYYGCCCCWSWWWWCWLYCCCCCL